MRSETTLTRPAIAYSVQGQGDAKVLMIMGFMMRGQIWAPVSEPLSERCTVATFDHRGIGESPSTPGRLTTRMMANDALRVLDQLGWERAHLVGVSMGGMVAQELALLSQDRFQTLTLIATQPGGAGRFLPTLRGLRIMASARGEQRTRRMIELLYPSSYVRDADPQALLERTREQFRAPPPLPVRLQQLGAVLSHRALDRLSALRIPTLVIKPSQDLLIRPSNSDRLAKAIPNARLLTLPRAGHGLVYQESRALCEALWGHIGAQKAAA